jgi:hypothetical protein
VRGDSGSGGLEAISGREASIYACLVDAYCDPGDRLPPVSETGAVAFLDQWVARSPRLNATALRSLLYACELAPLAAGYGHRFRRLDREHRLEFVQGMERSPLGALRAAAKLMKVATSLGYYGDDEVLRRIGYEPDALLERSRSLRAEQGRP